MSAFRHLWVFLIVVGGIFVLPITSQAQQSDCIKVGYHQFPGVIEKSPVDGSLTGLAQDILTEIKGTLGRTTCMVEYPTFKKIFPAVERGEVDLMVGAFTVTQEREAIIDFSFPFMNAGVGILVPHEGGGMDFIAILRALANPVSLQAFVFLLALIAVGGCVLWLLEKMDNRGIANGAEGIRDGIDCVQDAVTTMGFGRAEARTWLGRLFILVLFFIGQVPMGTIDGQIASELTVSKLETSISNPKALKGQTVATKAGTSNVALLRRLGAKVVTAPTRDGAVELLRNGKAVAVVYDSPYLQRVATQDSELTVSAVFAPQHYGMAMPTNSEYRDSINAVLLKMWGSGQMAQLTKKYFGE